MAFYSLDASMDQRLCTLVDRLDKEWGLTPAADLSITWVRYPRSLQEASRSAMVEPTRSHGAAAQVESPRLGSGASWQGRRLRDPGSLVQLVYLIATERWLQRELLDEEPELRRALEAMARRGSHEATSYVVDRLSGTTSGPVLPSHHRHSWFQQRRLVNAWLASLGWPELEGCNASQKIWLELPYGRERDFLGSAHENANRFSSEGLARLFEAVIAGTLISPPACQRMRALLATSTDEDDAEAVTAPPLSGVLSPETRVERLWGLADPVEHAPRLVVYGESKEQDPCLLVVLAEGAACTGHSGLLASIVAELTRPDPQHGVG